jgi:pimeloyl-ACP methyl ester carboxylesterase
MSSPVAQCALRLALALPALFASRAYLVIAFGVTAVGSTVSAQESTLRVTVPVARTIPSLGSTTLEVDLGAPFDPRKPTVLVIEDGQQYYVRRGAMKALQAELFGTDVNVAGIIPRGSDSSFIAAVIEHDGNVNWERAWRVFNSTEWIADIDAVRRALVGSGRVDLFGRSGGAYLVHEYLAAYGTHARRAFTQSAVDPALNRELHIPLDDYVEQLTRSDSVLWHTLVRAMPPKGERRLRALIALQRQHFYVPAESLAVAQRALISALAAGDTVAIRGFEQRYEVDDIMRLERSRDAIPQHVRVLELLYPSGAFANMLPDRIYPLLESQKAFIRPLLDLVERGEIAVAARDTCAAHRVPTDLFVLAARFDEAVDYRTSIALASEYPSHELFIANDNHVFQAMDKAGVRARLVKAFFGAGRASRAFSDAMRAAEGLRWTPDPLD